MTESPIHLKLKEISKMMLVQNGYKEISEEEAVIINNKSYRVDLVGRNGRESIAWDYFLENDWYRYESLCKMKAKPFIMKFNGRRDIPLLSAFTRWVDHAYKARKKSLGELESFKTFLSKQYPRIKQSL